MLGWRGGGCVKIIFLYLKKCRGGGGLGPYILGV